jgi:hypothetical protein
MTNKIDTRVHLRRTSADPDPVYAEVFVGPPIPISVP